MASSDEGLVIAIHDVGHWNDQLDKAKESKKLVVVDFTASWCGPCRIMSPILSEWAKKFTNVLFFKVDVDELKSVAEDWAIEAMPTFIFLKEGKKVDTVVGARKEELHNKIEMHSATTVTAIA